MSTPKGQAPNPPAGHRKPPATENPPPGTPSLKCPRCDSPNTKFCYYNNYSLTQPRHFCKTCRRYWTKGGALRNVPVGGGCRKNKKLKLHPPPKESLVSASSAATSSSPFMNLKLFHGISPPAMDFQLHNSAAPLGGFDHNMQNLYPPHGGLASSIESLSSINQDLHWKLQQQRLAVLFGSHVNPQSHHQTPVPIMFQNLEISKPNGDHQAVVGSDQTAVNNTMEWFFGINSTQTPTSSGSNGNENVYGNVNDVQGWTTFRAGLP